MARRLPRKIGYALSDLKICWKVRSSDLQQWLSDGDLQAHVWLPVMSAYKMLESAEGETYRRIWELCHWEGYVPISRHFCHRLFRHGRVRLREFESCPSGERYSLPETAEDLVIELEDLVVLEKERLRFEDSHCLSGMCDEIEPFKPHSQDAETDAGGFSADSAFKIIRYEGNEYRLGDMQAKVLLQLYESAKDGEPWQSGKRLLEQAGSQSFTLSNLFKRNPVWRKVVLSDGRGAYRLSHKLTRISS